MTIKQSVLRIRRLKSDLRGATVLEFALLAPVFMGLLIGVLEVGVYMQNYNAVRNLASDAARMATVEYQKKNEIGRATLETSIKTMGTSTIYNLDEDALTVLVTPVVNSRVTGAKEFTLDLTYAMPSISGLALDEFTMTYQRPLFVIDNAYTPSPTPTPTATATVSP